MPLNSDLGPDDLTLEQSQPVALPSSAPPSSPRHGWLRIALIAILVVIVGGAIWLIARATAPRPLVSLPSLGITWQSATSTNGGLGAEATSTSPATVDAAYLRAHGLLLIEASKGATMGMPSNELDSSIYVINLATGSKTLLAGSGGFPSFTPDGRVVYASMKSGSPEIWLMDADGGNAHQVGLMPRGTIPIMPQMGKNGLIAFHAASPTQNEVNAPLMVIREDGSGLREVVKGGALSLAPSGTWMAYEYETEGPYHRELWRVNIDGTGNTQLTFATDTPNYPDANAPSVSPDERWIAFFSGKESDPGAAGFTQDPRTWGYRNIAVIPSTGGVRRTVTHCRPLTDPGRSSEDCVAADNPSWTPDGSWILHDTDKPGVWLIDVNGENGQLLYSQGRGTVRVPLIYN